MEIEGSKPLIHRYFSRPKVIPTLRACTSSMEGGHITNITYLVDAQT